MPLVVPSLLAANFLNLQAECDMVNDSQADWLHLDVMDGRFVPNISFGLPVISQVTKASKKPCDVHLMILEPERYIEAFKNAGADHISVHIEASPHLHRTIQLIKSLGMKAGVAINPHMPISLLADIIADIDIVLMMTVNPGFGGQEFIPHSLQKIRQAKQLITETGSKAIIEIDGGVTLDNAPDIVRAGADALIAGSTVFKAADPIDTIAKLKAVQ